MAGSSGSNQKATFSLNLDGNAAKVSAQMAGSLDGLRRGILANETAIKEYSSNLRRLKGSSDDVKNAKEQLKNKINAAKDSITSATVAIQKQGTSYDKLATAAKSAGSEASERAKAVSSAVSAAGGPVAALKDKWSSFSEVVGGSDALLAAATFGVAALVAGVAALTAATVTGAVAFTKWVIGTSDAARSMNLMREAAFGSAANAKAMGTQIDALAEKIDTPREKLNELAVSLARTRLTGPEIVDAFNAIGQAGAAMGDTVGNQFKDILTRGQRFQRLQINPFELQGTGIQTSDIAAQLASDTGTSIRAAQLALAQGRVKLDVGAKAVREAIEKRFGGVNADKLLALDKQFDTFKTSLSRLAEGVNIDPLLKSIKGFFDLFDPSKNYAAQGLKQVITLLGNNLVGAMANSIPKAKDLMLQFGIGAVELALAFYDVRDAVEDAFANNPALASLLETKNYTEDAKLAMSAFKDTLILVGAAAGATAYSIAAAAKATNDLIVAVKSIPGDVQSGNFKALGKDSASGFINGMNLMQGPIAFAGQKIGELAHGSTKKKLQINSPSKLFEELGRGTVEGYVKGVDGESPTAARAVSGIGGGSPRGGGGGGGRGAPINFTVNIDARGATKEAVADLKNEINSGSLKKQLTKALDEYAARRGIAVAPLGLNPKVAT